MIGINDKVENKYRSFSKFDFSNNKSYLATAYSSNKIQYYNDPIKNKHKKIKRIAIIATTAVAFTTAILMAFTKNKNDYSVISSYVSNTGKNIETDVNQVITKVKEYNLKDRIAKAMTNFTNVKDDFYNRKTEFLENFKLSKPLIRFNNFLTNCYTNRVKISSKREYEAIETILKKYNIETKFKNFEEMFSSYNDNIKKAIKCAPEERISTFANLTKGDKNSIKNLYNNVTTKSLADEKIAQTITLDIINPDICDIEEAKIAIKKYNELQTKVIVPKLRDIICGSAPTDVITVATPIAGLAIAVANTDDKDEKKSTIIDLGIPLISTVTMPILGLFYPILNGPLALVVGLASGKILSFIAGTVDDLIEKKGKTKTPNK